MSTIQAATARASPPDAELGRLLKLIYAVEPERNRAVGIFMQVEERYYELRSAGEIERASAWIADHVSFYSEEFAKARRARILRAAREVGGNIVKLAVVIITTSHIS